MSDCQHRYDPPRVRVTWSTLTVYTAWFDPWDWERLGGVESAVQEVLAGLEESGEVNEAIVDERDWSSELL